MTTAAKLVEGIRDALTPEACQQFEEQGFCVVKLDSQGPCDPQAWSTTLRKCYESNLMSPNQVQFTAAGQSKPICLTKPNIFEADMHDASIRKQLPDFDNLFSKEMVPLIQTLNTKIPTLQLAGHDSPLVATKSITVKLQVNTGGAFPWHYDNPGPPNKRKLTLALYLTEDWKESDGGEIVLLPFLGEQVKVPPTLGTLVLFRSDSVMHRVLARDVSAPGFRRCFTIWFDAEDGAVNSDAEVNLRAKHMSPDFIPQLINSPVQRSLSRAVYDEIYREALLDCFQGANSQEARISLAIHEAHLKPLQKSEAVMQFVSLLRKQAKFK